MAIPAYLEKFSTVQADLLSYLDDELENENDLQVFLGSLQKSNIINNKNDSKLFYCLLLTIASNHHNKPNFFTKIKNILRSLQNHLKNIFTSTEIFNLFKENKKIILYLIEEHILNNDEDFLNEVIRHSQSDKNYFYYFYPETLPNPPERYVEDRQIGENNSYICSLIRQDLVEEFVSYTSKTNLPLTSKIKESIFETNSFLIGKNPSLIEYAAFFGSIQIFQFLRLNHVPLTSSLWLYSIHSNNADLIHLLEENKVQPEDKSFKKCYNEAVKCHHNDIANYIQYSYFQQSSNTYSTIKYYNFSLIEKNQINEKFLFDLCKKDYVNLVEILLNEGNIDINHIRILTYMHFIIF